MHLFYLNYTQGRGQGKWVFPMCMTFAGVGVEDDVSPQESGEIQSRQCEGGCPSMKANLPQREAE